MHQYELIDKKLIVSETARHVYCMSAAVSLTLYASLVGVRMSPSAFWKWPILLGVLGMAITAAGMEVFLFRFDESAAWKQIFWFCLMLFVPLGPAVYCYLVYSRSTVVRATCDAEMTISAGQKLSD